MQAKRNHNTRRGSSVVEFGLVFLPMIFLVTGVFEIGRAMWTFHSVSAAVKQATRYAVVRGSSCSAEVSGCAPSVAAVAETIRKASLGLAPEQLSLTLEAGSQTVTCDVLSTCLADSSYWPASPNNTVGRMVTVSGEYSFRTFLFSFWPELNRTGFKLRSESSEVIQF